MDQVPAESVSYQFGPATYEPDREGFIAANPQVDWESNNLVTGWDRLRQCYDYMIIPNEVIERWRQNAHRS